MMTSNVDPVDPAMVTGVSVPGTNSPGFVSVAVSFQFPCEPHDPPLDPTQASAFVDSVPTNPDIERFPIESGIDADRCHEFVTAARCAIIPDL
jgi:hypothetical protein